MEGEENGSWRTRRGIRPKREGGLRASGNENEEKKKKNGMPDWCERGGLRQMRRTTRRNLQRKLESVLGRRGEGG